MFVITSMKDPGEESRRSAYVPFGGHISGGRWLPGCEPPDGEILCKLEKEGEDAEWSTRDFERFSRKRENHEAIEQAAHNLVPKKVSLKTCSRERCQQRLEYLEGLLREGKRRVYPEVLRLRRELAD